MRVSIHVATKDRFTELALLLASLREQTFKDWDLVIVDGSKPEPAIARKFIQDILNRIRYEGHGVQYEIEDYPLGVCEARNYAIEKDEFKNPLICRIDDDSIVNPDYLERLYGLINSNDKIGAVGGIVPLYGMQEIFRPLDKVKPIFNRVEMVDGEPRFADDGWYSYEPAVLKSHHLRSSFMFRRDVAIKIGMFCRDYGVIGFREETDFCLKMLMEGYELWTNTGAIAWHMQCHSGGCRRADYMQQVQIGNELFTKRVKEWIQSGKLAL
jgi:GT2 family glycosyltransferase